MKFVGRENELTAIHEKLHSKKSEQILIYGRRRIGKSELIKQALKDSEYKIIHYVCRKTTYEDNFSSLADAVFFLQPIPPSTIPTGHAYGEVEGFLGWCILNIVSCNSI